ncbi:MAG: Lrp/AsnC family transcriptional regulator [Desulfosarcinaceae bacterium]|nr:Lrp/AsnC family transcriptional regulator [Desulfosarcinaceae bacterium]
MKIDATTIAILRHLKDGRKSYKEIADDLALAENTVRARVNRLKEEGILNIIGMVDPEGLPGHTMVFIGVKLNTMNLVQKGKEFVNLRGIVSVSVVTGRFDLMLQVLLKEGFGLLEFYNDEVSRIDGIQAVETFVVYKGYNLRAPYLL